MSPRSRAGQTSLSRLVRCGKEKVKRIRFERAGGRCEFPGCAAVHGQPHPLTGAVIVLTVAHLDYTPENCGDDNLLADCRRCHNRYDRAHRNATRNAGKRSLLMTLPFEEPEP